MTVTTVEIDKDKVAKARELTGARSMRDVINLALDTLIESRQFDAESMAARIEAIHQGTLARLADR